MHYNRLQRANRVATRVFKIYHHKHPKLVTDEERGTYTGGLETTLGSYRKTKVPCSNFCCGNPRRHSCRVEEKLSVQEKKAIEDERDQYEVVGWK